MRLFWLDLEMTGLIPEVHNIIEVASIITGENFQELEAYESVVKQPQSILDKMNDWNEKCHKKSGLYEKIPHGKDLKTVEKELIALLGRHFPPEEKIVICGNCIYQDRAFIRRFMPKLDKKLYYRMLDVTAWKIFFESKGFVFKKENRHRALEDTKESIREFQYYLKHMELRQEG